MAVEYKILGQSNPAANTLSTLYAVPALTQAVVSTVTICNTSSATSSQVRIAARPLGASITTSHYVLHDVEVDPLETITLTLGVTMGATDVLSVRSTASTVAFNAFGSEVTP